MAEVGMRRVGSRGSRRRAAPSRWRAGVGGVLLWAVVATAEAAGPVPGAAPAGPAGGGAAVVGPALAPVVPGHGVTALYRSTLPDGGVVIGDRPEPGARGVERIGTVAVGEDRAEVQRARQEREYWRQRAEAIAQRQRERSLREEAERDRLAQAEREQASAVVVLGGPPILYRPREQLNYTGQQPDAVYGSTAGAAGRGLSTDGRGAGVGGWDAPGVGAGAQGGVGTLGGGAAAAATSGFVGSGFGRAGGGPGVGASGFGGGLGSGFGAGSGR